MVRRPPARVNFLIVHNRPHEPTRPRQLFLGNEGRLVYLDEAGEGGQDVRYAKSMLAAILATAGLATFGPVPVAAQGKAGGLSGQGVPGGPQGGLSGSQRQGGLPGENPAMVMFRALDTNGDGVVTEEEFLAPHEQRFDAMDTNGDGRLTPEEFNPMASPPPGFGTPLKQDR